MQPSQQERDGQPLRRTGGNHDEELITADRHSVAVVLDRGLENTFDALDESVSEVGSEALVHPCEAIEIEKDDGA